MENKEKEMQLKVEIFKGICQYYHEKGGFTLKATELAIKTNYAYQYLLKDIKN